MCAHPRPDRCITGRIDPGILLDKVEIEGIVGQSMPLVFVNMAGHLSFDDTGAHFPWLQSFQKLWGSVVQITDAVAKGGTIAFFCHDTKTMQSIKGQCCATIPLSLSVTVVNAAQQLHLLHFSETYLLL